MCIGAREKERERENFGNHFRRITNMGKAGERDKKKEISCHYFM